MKRNYIAAAVKAAKKLDVSRSEIARRCGVTHRAVRHWEDMRHLPRSEWCGLTNYAQILSEASGGAVTADQILSMIPPVPSPRKPPPKRKQRTAASK